MIVKPIIPFREAPLTNNFMFCEVMQDPAVSKTFLEELLQVKIAEIVIHEKEYDVSDKIDAHGIRLDVYLEDEKRTRYDIEMQAAPESAIEWRIRYYQSGLDRRFLDKGAWYEDLPNSYVIFICDYDPYRGGLACYERVSWFKDAQDIAYDDGTRVIILNSRYKMANVSKEIEIFLNYIKEKSDSALPDSSELALQLKKKLNAVREDKYKEEQYMTYEIKLREEFQQGWAGGVEEGRQEGLQEGLQKGRQEGGELYLNALNELFEALDAEGKSEEIFEALKSRQRTAELFKEYGIVWQ